MSIEISNEAIATAETKLKDIIQGISNSYFKSIQLDTLQFENVNLQLLEINDPKDQWYAPQQQRQRYDTFISSKLTSTIRIKGGFCLSYDYPESIPFIGLPVHLEIELNVSIIVYFVYIDGSFKISVRGVSNLETGNENILKSCTVVSEIGDSSKLKNLKALENFIHVLLEEGLKDEIGFPNFYEFQVPYLEKKFFH